MGRLLNLVAPDPGAAVSRLPQPFRMIDKLASGIIQSAIDLAVQKESEKLAAEQLRDGTKVRATAMKGLSFRVGRRDGIDSGVLMGRGAGSFPGGGVSLHVFFFALLSDSPAPGGSGLDS